MASVPNKSKQKEAHWHIQEGDQVHVEVRGGSFKSMTKVLKSERE